MLNIYQKIGFLKNGAYTNKKSRRIPVPNLGILHSQVYIFFQNGAYYRIEKRMPKLEIEIR
jgi:hypothetical protein